MVKKIESWNELLQHYKQPLFFRKDSWSSDKFESGYWIENGKFYSNPDRLWFNTRDKTGLRSFQVNAENFDYHGTFYTGVPDDFHGWILYEENSDIEYARLSGKCNGKLKIVYCSDGDVVSDFNVSEYVDKKLADYHKEYPRDKEIHVGTEYMLTMFLLRALQNKASLDNCEFYYLAPNTEQVKFEVSKYKGSRIPDGIPYHGYTELCREIMRIGMENMMSQ